MNFVGLVLRFIVSFIVLSLAGFFVPGVKVNGFAGTFAATFIIALLTFVVERVAGAGRHNIVRRRVMGFITSAVVIYMAQFFIPRLFSVSVAGAILTAVFIGLIDTFIPSLLR